ncbi:FixH family protein [Mangrovivirga sp. M17]|uniref:FixH family protein n=1 Tax=Mangrovivirga halotolerans TaxID=2993936 RepID=A0ABT3RMB1_9BACT|nr:FixH family protein [Mangrovivirga halotolerans]MCX2742498.1 FixH family protein [Mangrovivirga halotolerans]
MNWGHKIIIAFVAFIAIMGTLVTVAMKQDFYLVEKEYYKEELAYQEVIDKMRNFNNLDVKPGIELNDNQKTLSLTFAKGNIPVEGLVHFYRVDNPNLDRKITLSNKGDESSYVFDLEGMTKGQYLLKLKWKDASLEYYTEKPVFIQ